MTDRSLRDAVHQALAYKPAATNWLDIGCGDGALLSLVPGRLYRVGIDPVPERVEAARKHADLAVVGYFDPAAVMRPAEETGVLDPRFDVITAIGVLPLVVDSPLFVEQVGSVLADKGVWVVQHSTLTGLGFLLDHAGLRVVNVSPDGPTVRAVVVHDGCWLREDRTVARQLARERRAARRDLAKPVPTT